MSKAVKKLLNDLGFKISNGEVTKEQVASYLNNYLAEQDKHFAEIAKIMRMHEERQEV